MKKIHAQSIFLIFFAQSDFDIIPPVTPWTIGIFCLNFFLEQP